MQRYSPGSTQDVSSVHVGESCKHYADFRGKVVVHSFKQCVARNRDAINELDGPKDRNYSKTNDEASVHHAS